MTREERREFNKAFFYAKSGKQSSTITSLEIQEAKAEKAKRIARTNLLAFMVYCWWEPSELLIGRHTRAICDRLTQAVDDYLKGKSTKLIIDVPYRHGKSDIVSRALPAFFLGRCAATQPDIMLCSYAASLSESFSGDVQRIMRSRTYAELFPEVKVPAKASKGQWSVSGSGGEINAVGVHGGATGKGAHLLIMDDPIKDEKEAYSETVRNDVISQFQTSFSSRLAPASIMIICNTRWHMRDLTGHVLEKMEKDPAYPRYEHLSFPARRQTPDGEYTYLFPERFSLEWYKNQYQTLRPVMASAMLDCNPIGDGVCVFQKEWIQTYNKMPPLATLNRYIFIDSANGKRKDNDYSCYFVIGLGADRNYYILDIIHDRLTLSQRTETLFQLWEKWQPQNTFWEQVGAMSDVEHVKSVQDTRGVHFPITPIGQNVAKDDRIKSLEPLFRLGRMWFPASLPKQSSDATLYDPIRDFIDDEYSTFPSVRHDDMLDCLANVNHEKVSPHIVFPHSAGLTINTPSGDITLTWDMNTGMGWRPEP